MRVTHALVQVAAALMADPAKKHWGYQLSKEARVRSGVLYPLLTRLLDQGWLADGWEDPTELTDKRPPRRYYKITAQGEVELAALLRAAANDARFREQIGQVAW